MQRFLCLPMKATVRHVNGFTTVSISGTGHYVVMDGRYKGKAPGASGPMEMLLMAVGSCTVIDVVNILEKRKIEFSDLKVEVEAEKDPEEGNFYRIARMRYHYTIRGDVPEEKLKKAIELSIYKYCSVGLNIDCEKSYSYEISPQGRERH